MSIIRFSPFETLDTIREQLAKSFEATAESCSPCINYSLPLELSEDGSNFYIKAVLPGVNSEEISIEAENGIVSICCETKSPEVKEGECTHFSELCYGKFRRSVRLGNIIDSENIMAEYKHGILSLTVPKLAKAIKKTIKINHFE